MARIATRPMNRAATREANDQFYANHPEMVQDGRRVPLDSCNPEHRRMQEEWMDLYVDNGGQVRRGRGSNTCGEPVESCEPDCTQNTFPPREVNESITQTISNAPAAYSAWNGTYRWRSKFTVTVNRPGCMVEIKVKLKIRGAVTDAQKNAWKAAVESKWSNKMKLVCNDTTCPAACPNGHPVTIVIEYVNSGEHQTVTANAPAAAAGGRVGRGGTTSMTGWGVNDLVDITHEFGHMLGNVDEYFTTNGHDYTNGGTDRGFRDPGGGVMNNPSNNPNPSNFDLIRRQVETVIGGGTSCTVENI